MGFSVSKYWAIVPKLLLCVLVLSGIVQTQSNAEEIPSVQTIIGELISPADAMDIIDGSDDGVTTFTYVSPTEQYHPHLDSRFIELVQSLGYDSVEWAAASSSELVEMKNDYIDAAYNYVKNGVEFTPMFGLQHGAMGAIYHGAGTAFDQSHLLVELMHAANITASYQIGQFDPTAAEFVQWFGTDVPKTACEILANGGIPAVVDGSTNCDTLNYNSNSSIDVSLSHIWVKIDVNGTNYQFDPSFKHYETYENKMYGSDFDLFSKSGLSASTLNSNVGGTVTNSGMVYTGPNPKTLRANLDARANALKASLEGENDLISTLYALGGRRLIVDTSVPRSTVLSGHTANVVSTATRIPKELTAYVTLGINMGSESPSFQGSTSIPLSRIGTDVVVLAPISLTNGGAYSDGPEVFTNSNSRFELSILRPGSIDHNIEANTGSNSGRAYSFDIQNYTSGDNLLDITMSLLDVTNKDWRIQMDYNAPFAGGAGQFGDRTVVKAADRFTATALIIQAGQNQTFVGQLYERYIPKKTNLWYGLYIDDHFQISQCSEQRMANFDSLLSGGGGGTLGGSLSYSGFTGMYSCGGTTVPGDTCLGINCPVLGSTYDLPGGGSCTPQPIGYSSYSNSGGSSFPSSGGGVVIPTDACFDTPESSTIKTVSHDKRIRQKAMAVGQWQYSSANIADLYGRLAGGRGSHILSLGIATSSIHQSYDLSIGTDALLIDVETSLSFASTANAKSLAAVGTANAAGLSALEGLILQNLTGVPRVDSAVTKTDWYAWNKNYDALSGLHNGPYSRDFVPSTTSINGSAVFEGYSPDDSVSSIEALAGTADPYMKTLTDAGYTHVRPQRFDLGPVEAYEQEGKPLAAETYTYGGRKGRKNTSTTYLLEDKRVVVAHIVGAGKKGGSGVTLPEFKPGELDAEELTKSSYGKLFGKFTVDDHSGDFSFSIEDEIVLGGQDHNKLSFSRNYETSNQNHGPLGQGWGHNHDAKIVLATDLGTAFDGVAPVQSLPAIIAALATMELAEVGLPNNDWTVMPKALLIHAWAAENIFDNQVIVTSSSGSDTFVRQPNNQFVNLSNPTSTLQQTGRAKFFEAVKPYIPTITKQDLIQLQGEARAHNPLYPRRFWVSHEQYLDYSDVDFVYTTSGKTVLDFDRGQRLLTDTASLSCFPDITRPYRNTTGDYCGKEAGSWRLQSSLDVTEREILYTYGDISVPATPPAGLKTGGVLTKVRDNRYNFELLFDYEASIGGIRWLPDDGLDNPSDELWVLSQSQVVPDSSLTHGQFARLKKVYTNITDGPEVTFTYDAPGGLNNPLLKYYTNSLGITHEYEYVPIEADGNTNIDKVHLLKSFTPATLSTPVFDLTYSPQGRVTAMTDADGRTSVYGINGTRNQSVDPLGNKTISHFDPQGRLVEQREPAYED